MIFHVMQISVFCLALALVGHVDQIIEARAVIVTLKDRLKLFLCSVITSRMTLEKAPRKSLACSQ